jgi:hypothetical protein
MELRKFIATTIREYLNEQQIFENKDNENLSFPNDFIKRQTRVQYLYQMGAMRPNGSNDDWYESKQTFTKKYKGIPVEYKILKNMDGSDRGYEIINVGFDGDRITIQNNIPSSDEVRKAIDDYYKDFIKLMSSVDINEDDIKSLFIEKGIDTKKMYDNSEDGLYETAIKWVINKRFTILEKRKILKNLMNKGLSTEDAINFFKFVR